MPGVKKIRSAVCYGLSHLNALDEDVQTEPAYTRAMRTDMNLAIKLLALAPAMIKVVAAYAAIGDAGEVDGSGDISLETLKLAHDILKRVYG